ncbi:GerAB/ArcD/ProY family transporter [Rossellomorea marisflavi]|uniref:GerAB/ArcD/ProY family transporter n=1 Tax=Rossellomorea marisflavi TaxID=189381 RepID=UPI00203B0485|nr:GerAB/ArcD/ProY family transporter [Rossellomorea marisflavi]MCM2589298.1 spore germination protein [Rossellomorea marisflavi]
MTVNLNPQPKSMINAFLVMFIIHTAQTGVGIAGLPRVVFMEANRDAWICVFLSGLTISLVLFVMVTILKSYESADLYGIHKDVYGKWLSVLFNCIYIVYLLCVTFIIMMNYIEMVQAWIFPKIQPWLVMGLLLILLAYGVSGGFRVVAGICFLGFIFAFWLVFMIYTPIKFMSFDHLLPVMTASTDELMKGIYKSSFSMVGFELLFVYYPYIKEKQKVLKYALIGSGYTTILFTVLTVVSIGFFSHETLMKTIWPVLSMFKILRIPNLERFEFIAVSFWMLIILPNICVYFWSAVRGMKRTFNLSHKKTILIFSLMIWGVSIFLENRTLINTITDRIATGSFILSFVYPFILLILVKFRTKLIKRRNDS